MSAICVFISILNTRICQTWKIVVYLRGFNDWQYFWNALYEYKYFQSKERKTIEWVDTMEFCAFLWFTKVWLIFSINEYNHCKNICVYTPPHSTETFQRGEFLVHCQSATISVIHRHSHANTIEPVSYTHLTLPTINGECRSRWSPYQ